MHKTYPVLKSGSVKFLKEGHNLLSYGRFSEEERIAVVINNNNENIAVDIPVWETGMSRNREHMMKRVLDTNAIGFSTEEKEYPVQAGFLKLELSPLEAVVLYAGKK